MKAAAVFAAIGAIALSADQNSTRTVVEKMPNESNAGFAHAVGDEECGSAEALNWFAPEPRLVPCTGGGSNAYRPLLTALTGSTDVNGDGTVEFLDVGGPSDGVCVQGGVSTGISVSIWVSRINAATRAPTSIRDVVPVVRASFGDWVLATFPGVTSANLSLAGLRDMDGDGDADYLVNFTWLIDGVGETRQAWFENIGYEKPPPPLAADLNQDGDVNGIDLGLLLAAWTN
jgi:hypothetical protein